MTGATLSQNITNASVLSNHKPLLVLIYGWADAGGNIHLHLCRVEATKMS